MCDDRNSLWRKCQGGQLSRTQNPVPARGCGFKSHLRYSPDSTRIKPTESDKTPSFPEPSPSSSAVYTTPPSCQHPTEPDSIRPSTATQTATHFCQPHVTDDPDLAAIVDAWPDLPEAIKAGILAMVLAASGSRPDRGAKAIGWEEGEV